MDMNKVIKEIEISDIEAGMFVWVYTTSRTFFMGKITQKCERIDEETGGKDWILQVYLLPEQYIVIKQSEINCVFEVGVGGDS